MFTMQPLDRPEADQEPVPGFVLFQHRVYVFKKAAADPHDGPLVALVKGVPPMHLGDISAGQQFVDNHHPM